MFGPMPQVLRNVRPIFLISAAIVSFFLCRIALDINLNYCRQGLPSSEPEVMSYSLPPTLPSDSHATADTPTRGILDRFLQEDASFETTELTSAISAVLYKMYAVGHRYLPNIEVGLLNIEFFFQTLDELKVLQHVNPTGRCLEWTDVMYMTTPRFDAVCHEKHEFAHIDAGYCGEKGTYGNFTGKFGNGFCGTVYNATRIVPKNFIDLLICTQVFEHLEEPDIGARELYQVLAPEGLLLWTAPMTSVLHTAPGINHFYGYTVQGAVYTLSKAGFCVFHVAGGNDSIMTLLALLGRPKDEIAQGLGGMDNIVANFDEKAYSLIPLNIMVLAAKTKRCDTWRERGNFKE
jgi:hypothetical protein